MKTKYLIHNNYLIRPKDFINSTLSKEENSIFPSCQINESLDFYYINIHSFYNDKYTLEISYENEFLILKIFLNNNSKEDLFQRVFYLSKVDVNNILLHDFKNNLKLIIPKIV